MFFEIVLEVYGRQYLIDFLGMVEVFWFMVILLLLDVSSYVLSKCDRDIDIVI